MRVIPFALNELIAQDVSVLRDGPFFNDVVMGIALLAGHKENPALGPGPEKLVVEIAPIHRHDRAGRKAQGLGNANLVDLPGRDTGKNRQRALMVEQQVSFTAPLV